MAGEKEYSIGLSTMTYVCLLLRRKLGTSLVLVSLFA